MTVIAAIAHKGRVWMAGDGWAVSGSDHVSDCASKVSRYAGGAVVAGSTGSWLECVLPHVDWSKRDWQLELSKQIETRSMKVDDAHALIGHRGKIWCYCGSTGLFRSGGYDAIGSAAGAMLCTLALTDGMPPAPRLRACMKAVIRHCPTIGGRVTVVSTR